jgi:hypothetical protein
MAKEVKPSFYEPILSFCILQTNLSSVMFELDYRRLNSYIFIISGSNSG